MYPKHFLERFWSSEQKDQLFFGAPFDDSVENNFKIVDEAAKTIGFKQAFRVGIETEANSIHDRILDSIANSRMLLFDLSEDTRTGQVNPNVVYELGIASAIREPSDIVIIRKRTQSELKLPFDIQGVHVNLFDNNLTKEFVEEKVASALQNQQWHKSKRITSAIESLDENALSLIIAIGRKPKRHAHFNSEALTQGQKTSLLRMIDLGIVKFACEIWPSKAFEYAYHWTSFGYAVMKNLGIDPMSEEEFKKHPEYPKTIEAENNFQATKKKFS